MNYLRLRFATFAACFPNAVRVRFGSFDIVRLRRAAPAAFLMFRRAAARCLADAIKYLLAMAISSLILAPPAAGINPRAAIQKNFCNVSPSRDSIR
jgi:hypothetical protein